MNAVRLLILLILTACNAQQGQEGVSVKTSGIFNPISLQKNGVEVSPVEDMGEYLIGTGKQLYKFNVRNNSLYPIIDLNVEMDAFQSFGFAFEKNAEGKAKFPGASGTCTSTLAPGLSCDIVFEFETNIKGQYEKDFTFSYKNLVESASRNIKLLILAGNPASLIFEGDLTNFHFGSLIGIAKTPVTERDEPIEYTQDVKVINAGDLKARNIVTSLSQSCFSKKTKNCPPGQNTAYVLAHNCPAELKYNEFCTLTIKYTPKNQDVDPANPNPAFANIRYDSIMRLDYQTSSYGTPAALNGYVTTTSANIEAVFETSIENQPFEGQVVVGNRQTKVFRINNRGYREGKMRKVIAKQMNGSHVASCIGDSGSQILKCYDSTLTTPITQAQFPFFIKDKDTCLNPVLTASRWVNVDEGCQFEFIFQPSIAYTTALNFEYELFAEYDSNWKGNETIRTNQLHTVTASSLHAAKLVPVGMTFNNQPILQKGAGDTVKLYHNGRIALQSLSSFRRRSLTITFENQGGVTATSVLSRDGASTNIPQKELTTTGGVRLGPLAIKHYEKTLISTSFCTEIAPGMRCTISTSYAPIHTGSSATNAQAAFDVFDPTTFEGYKRFIMQYKNGAIYNDGNLSNVPDEIIQTSNAEAQYSVDMVEKGLLADYVEDLDLRLGSTTYGNEKRLVAVLENIGIANVTYIPWTGTDISLTDFVTMNPTPDEYAFYGAQYDCRNIIDFGYRSTDTLAMILARNGSWDPLPPEKKCLLVLETRSLKKRLSSNPTDLNLAVFGGDLGRLFRADQNNTQLVWEPRHFYTVNFEFKVNSYDGDLSDPTATNAFKETFGKLTVGREVIGDLVYDAPAKLIATSPRPLLSSILYRQAITLPDLLDESNAVIKAGQTYPNLWYFSDNNLTMTDNTVTSYTNPNFSDDIMKGFWSKNIIPSQIPMTIDFTSYDFVYYVGTYPVNTSAAGSFKINNTGRKTATVISKTFTQLLPAPPAAQALSVSHLGLPQPMPLGFIDAASGTASGGFVVNVGFAPTAPGFYASELSFNYYDSTSINKASDQIHCGSGGNTSNCTVQRIKVLVLGEGLASAPQVNISVADYKVDVRDSQVPDVSLQPEVAFNAGIAEANSPTGILLEYVKVPAPNAFDGYAKKRIYFRNPSATDPVTEFKIIFRNSPSGTLPATLNDAPNSYVCINNTLPHATFGTLCEGTCSSTSLAPGGSCYVEIRYQPTNTAVMRTAYLTVIHKLASNRYMHKNVEISLTPRDPALLALDRGTEIIRTTPGNLTSYSLSFGTSSEQIADPMIFEFKDTGAGLPFRRLTFTNLTTTRASFLKAYHDYRKQETGFQPSLDTVPAAADYTERVVGGVGYTTIFLRKYSNGNPRIRILASKACLVGDDEPALQHFQKGFLSTSASPCVMLAILYLNLDYMARSLDAAKAVDMDPNSIRLPYYNSNRSSTAFISFHFRGRIMPNRSILGTSTYTEVESFNTTDRQIRFKWSTMTPRHPSLGSIVGYRVYYSTSSSTLSDIYNTTASYVDVGLVGTGVYQFTHPGLTAFRYYFYRVAAIRQSAGYTFSPNPFGLPIGRYISDPGATVLSVAVPGSNMFYDHANRFMIERNNFRQEFMLQSQAKSACEARGQTFSKNGANTVIRFRMINQIAWNLIKANPTQSTVGIFDFPLWLDQAQLNIHTTLLVYPAYRPTVDADYLDDNKIFYIKGSGCGNNCPGFKAVGNAFGKPDYDSFIVPTTSYAGARCYIPVPI